VNSRNSLSCNKKHGLGSDEFNNIIIVIINKYEKNTITIEEKPYILFKEIKNYKNLGMRSLIFLLIL